MAVQEVAQKAADYGINYGLEVVNRYETNILNTSYQVSLLLHPGKVPYQCGAPVCIEQMIKRSDAWLLDTPAFSLICVSTWATAAPHSDQVCEEASLVQDRHSFVRSRDIAESGQDTLRRFAGPRSHR